jgi:acetylornithine deacetylase/succinyl-diaminopimelate desuccinylase-like protein
LIGGFGLKLWKHIVDAVDEKWIVERARSLIEIPSVTMEEKDICKFFETQLCDFGLHPEIREVTPGRSNLYAQAGDLTLSVDMVHQREPFETSTNDSAVLAVEEAHRLVTGNECDIVGKRVVGDANLYVNRGGVPAFYYGPSNETSHSDEEWVSSVSVEQAARVYALSAALYCGIKEG